MRPGTGSEARLVAAGSQMASACFQGLTPVFLGQQNLTTERFLRDYWQRKPLLLRSAFPDFQPELDADDIAGLACDELAEARLVTGRFPATDWTVRHGPFDARDFATLPERDWTLLVQDVEKHFPPLRSLLAAFSFLPRWRIDDLMVSVAGPGGSVGPHVDQYDVFLLQASGRRRWKIASRYDPELLPDCELNILRNFDAEQTWDLGPGDMLYLPPGIAHHGTALSTGNEPSGHPSVHDLCMTWSIGMRAPSAADLLQALGEWLAQFPGEGGRYRDAELEVAERNGEIDINAVAGLQGLARSAIDDPKLFPDFVGTFLSGYRLAHEPAPPYRSVAPEKLLQILRQGTRLQHNPWTRLLWLSTPQETRLFAAGSSFPCSPELAAILCEPELLQSATATQLSADPGLLCELINRGHLIIESL